LSPVVDAIVVTYNSEQHIAGCLRALRKALRARGSIFVVDNASVDATLAESDSVAMFAEDVHVDAHADNIGFGAAVNIASARTDADYILLVNPDVELEGDAVDALLALAANFPDAGIYGGCATLPDGTIDPTTCLAAPTLWSAAAFGLGVSALRFLPSLDPESLGGWRRDSVRPVPALAGTVLLLDARLWRELGGFDETFFLYGEDVDLCLRAADRGHTAMFSPSVRYTHAAGASSGPVRRMELILTGRMTLYRRALDTRAARVAAWCVQLGVGLRALGETLLRRPDASTAVWRNAWRTRSTWKRGWSRSPPSLRNNSSS
jgi:N-acetylglucosaminyl-diphospho-decaprenol L-rhamnosyltransferase